MTSNYIAPNDRVVHGIGIKMLLVVQFLTILPFAFYMPWWLLVVFFVVVLWRFRVLRGELRKPPLVIIILSILVGVGGLLISGLSRYSLDTAVAFCLLGYLLKSLEVLRRRDAIFQIYLGLFLTGVFLLYRFDPVGALVMVMLLFFNVLALQTISAELHFNFKYALKTSSILVFMAIPVMAMGYLFFPRLPPLWHIPNDQRGAVTGMSEELAFGSVSDLAQSSSPAFRVQFEGDIPPRGEWYWRGMTLSDFDGRTWRVPFAFRAFGARRAQFPVANAQSDLFNYTVIMENSGRNWLYFLDWPVSVNGEGTIILPDARAAKRTPLSNVYRYQAASSPSVRWSESEALLAANLRLPANGNQQLREWAVDQREWASSDAEFVEWLLQYIRTEPFYYTLKPPLYLNNNGIESFWFGDRSGFCEHYASAVAFILRSVGIPSRIVGGYLGGTYVDSGNYIQVRQMEAHAWVESWIDGRWQRIDPTAAVAPGRIDVNLDELFTQTQPSDLPLISRVGQIGLFNRMTMIWDSIQYRWQVSVLDYTNETAIGWFETMFGQISAMKLTAAFFIILGIVSLLTALMVGMVSFPKRVSEPFSSVRRIEKWYGKRAAGETLVQYFRRLEKSYPEIPALSDLSQIVEQALYSGKQIDRSLLRRTVRLSKKFQTAKLKNIIDKR